MSLLKRWLPAIVVICTIFILSSIKGSTINEVGLGKEAYNINAHFFLYFLLGLTLYYAVRDFIFAFELGALHATLDEIHQLAVPGRSWQIIDLKIDVLGMTLALIIIWLGIKSKKLKI